MKKVHIMALIASSVLIFSACTPKDDKELVEEPKDDMDVVEEPSEDNEEIEEAPEINVVVESSIGNITEEEFYQELLDQAGESVLHNMILEKVLSEKYELTTEEKEEIDRQIEKIKVQYGDNFELALHESGFKDEEAYRKALKMGKLESKAQAEAFENMEVSDKDIQEKYEKMKEEIRVSHILVDDEEKANGLLEQLNQGADFAKLAASNSKDGSAAQGGDLGFINKDINFVQPFLDAAFELAVGEVSEPVKTMHGWHIIKVTDDNSDLKLEEVEQDIRESIKQEQFNPQQLIEQLINESQVDIKLDQFKDLFTATES